MYVKAVAAETAEGLPQGEGEGVSGPYVLFQLPAGLVSGSKSQSTRPEHQKGEPIDASSRGSPRCQRVPCEGSPRSPKKVSAEPSRNILALEVGQQDSSVADLPPPATGKQHPRIRSPSDELASAEDQGSGYV
ncbi:hypothetical protein TGAM01_v200497 [Trichoderma gamsii]|uniref:Uncharacterized protein n=1 Tax=Trichoderma gamsii TaxID=398673 RepID=A0A2P5A3F7_9HYPO|nr:hypothetical protein TGAM01_v200497 [Trichoderma gamsii]PON31076.1 hypothetical protein TGAM01_v200497 [Trichoderma gamsii]